MKKQVEVWLGFAEKDMLAVSEIINNSNLTNIATFHCQQAIEKYFKAFILENGKPLMKIHNLLALYGIINQPRRRADGVWLVLIGMDFMRV
jgi:HEPN domain-containing protein